eukprot:3361522-Rhodomonas_salina.1
MSRAAGTESPSLCTHTHERRLLRLDTPSAAVINAFDCTEMVLRYGSDRPEIDRCRDTRAVVLRYTYLVGAGELELRRRDANLKAGGLNVANDSEPWTLDPESCAWARDVEDGASGVELMR